MGGFSDQVATNGLNSLFVPIYNIGFAMSSVLIGWAAAIPRLIDTLSDPVMGNISDNSRSRFGRRRPFVFAGAFLMALGFGLSYMASPYWGSAALFAFAYAWDEDSITFSVTAIPEPSAWIAAAALLGLLLWRGRSSTGCLREG